MSERWRECESERKGVEIHFKGETHFIIFLGEKPCQPGKGGTQNSGSQTWGWNWEVGIFLFILITCCWITFLANRHNQQLLLYSISLELRERCPLQPVQRRCWSTSIVLDGEWVMVTVIADSDCSQKMGERVLIFFCRCHHHGDSCDSFQVS